MNESTDNVEKLRKYANSRFDSSTAGVGVLTAIIVLSGILSAVFFWRHSATVFAGLPPLIATALGLLIGLVPSEGAFFGWKRIRATKTSMTGSQLKASTIGLWASVMFAVTNVVAIFVTSFADLPAQVQQLSGWIAFFALMLPIPVQFMLYAQFVVNEQSVKENHLNAKLEALMFNAYIKGEEARIGAMLLGMQKELNATLPEYGTAAGRENAERALRDGRRDMVSQYYGMGNVTNDSPAGQADVVYPLAQPVKESGVGNGPASKPLGRPANFQ